MLGLRNWRGVRSGARREGVGREPAHRRRHCPINQGRGASGPRGQGLRRARHHVHGHALRDRAGQIRWTHRRARGARDRRGPDRRAAGRRPRPPLRRQRGLVRFVIGKVHILCTRRKRRGMGAPTGDELPDWYEHMKRVSNLLGSTIWPIFGGTLKSVCDEENALPNWRMRFCTRRLKIEPFKAFCISAAPGISYVGLRADEAERTGIDHGGDLKVSDESNEYIAQRYPLRELGWGLSDVLSYLTAKKIDIPERTDCARCFYQTIYEWWMLWRRYPEIFDDCIEHEKRFGHTFRSRKVDESGDPVIRADLFSSWSLSHRDSWPASLEEMRQRFERGDVPRKTKDRKMMCRACTL